VSPYGVVTKITLNKAGYIAAITNPAGKSHKAKYDTKGLMTSFADPRGMISTFTYDAQGRLVADKNAAGGKQTLLATSDDNSVTVNRSSALGRVTSYQQITSVDGSSERKIVEPAGLITTIVKQDDASQSISASNGVLQALDFADDLRFGASAAVLSNQTITMPSGKALSLNASRTATLSDQNDVMSLTQQLETFSLNGKTFNREYLQSNRTFAETSPEGRKTLITIDAQGRVIAEQVAGLHGVSYSYDTKGRLSTVSMGEGGDQRQVQYGYDAKGFLQSVTDPMGGVTSVLRDKAGQAIKMQLPGQRQQKFSFDAAGNLLSYTNLANKVYKYSHSKTGQVNKIVFPKAKGAKTTESAVFNTEDDVVSAIQMSGLQLNYGYDTAGRLTSLSSNAGSWQYTYNQSLGYLNSITGPDGVVLSYSRDGDLLTGMSWSGAVSGSVGIAHNTDFLLQEVTVNGVNPIEYSYDQDGLLQSVGSLTLAHSNQNTLLTATTLANVSDSYSYTDFGEVSHYQARFNSEILLTEDYSYDKLGRIIERREKVQADPEQVFTYSYDNAGQLSVVNEGQNTVNYSYDKNGNRINTAAVNGAIAASYDAQDRLLNFGTAKFTYSGNGETLSRTDGAQITRFEYNALGNLQAVLLPTGRIDYLLDGAGQRVGKKVANVLVQQFLYQGHLQPLAELDGRGNLGACRTFPCQRHAFGKIAT
jgi:YD repeat-containing protein